MNEINEANEINEINENGKTDEQNDMVDSGEADKSFDAPEISSDMSGEGRLTVRVFTAYGAIPLEGAVVNIRDTENSDGGIVVSLRTDRSGLTPTVVLPAPPRALAQAPGKVKPFSTYGTDVLLDGYYTAIFENVPIYDGVSSLQNAALIPLPENGYPDSRRPDGKLIYPESSAPGL